MIEGGQSMCDTDLIRKKTIQFKKPKPVLALFGVEVVREKETFESKFVYDTQRCL